MTRRLGLSLRPLIASVRDSPATAALAPPKAKKSLLLMRAPPTSELEGTTRDKSVRENTCSRCPRPRGDPEEGSCGHRFFGAPEGSPRCPGKAPTREGSTLGSP